MSQKYCVDESSHPEFDRQVWCNAIGGMETTCTHMYGLWTMPHGKNLISPPISIGEDSYSSACSPLVEAPHSSTKVDNLQEKIVTVKNKLQSLEDS
ncbi:hypothetical protein IHE45_11G023600 [Dioscorea alata]|nr:hypothetical protein IHE45_11G023600 [Dioscorea alata]